MIPYLLPAQKKDFSKKHINQISLLYVQVSLFSITHYNSINFPTDLTYLVYFSLKDPEKMDRKQKCLTWSISHISWVSAFLGGITVFFFSVKGTEEDLVCWIRRDVGILCHLGMTFMYLMLILIILYNIKLTFLMIFYLCYF